MQYTGSRILIESLIEQGVDTVFGYPGGAVLNIYDELYKHRARIRHILVSHEQHAAHAADGYARSTGRTGVCVATSGPGATNLVTGIASAYMDSVPLVAITGNVGNSLLGKDSFQEVDITGITMPVVKHNWIVKDPRELAEVIREAFIVARSERPGPVLIDIPKDVTAAEVDISSYLFNVSGAVNERARRLLERARRKTFSADDIENALKILKEAEKPFIYAGGGVIIADASAELVEFAELLNAPVALSLMGCGAVPVGHPLCTGMIGMHGSVASNKAAQEADLLITIGARFSDRVTSSPDKFAKNARVLHFDIDPAEINKNIRTAANVTGNVKEILSSLIKKMKILGGRGGHIVPPAGSGAEPLQTPSPTSVNIPEAEATPFTPHAPWTAGILKLKEKTPASHALDTPRENALHPRFIIESAAQTLGEDAIVATDVGQHQMWAAQFYPFTKPRSFITSGGLGTMGFGLGAALGAKTGNPTRPVVLFTGDGSFRMNCAEMATLTHYKMPVLIIVFNNGTLGMVRQWQNLFYEKRYSESTLDRPPDFLLLAQAYGCKASRARNESEFTNALEEAKKELDAGGTYLIDAVIDIDEMVLPMVPSGKPIDSQIL